MKYFIIILIILCLIYLFKKHEIINLTPTKKEKFNNNIKTQKITFDINEKINNTFAFITTSYNQSQFIIKNLDSIRMQKYKNYKVYYVNDGSTDDTKQILKEYMEKYPDFNIKMFNNEKRYGPAYSRRKAYMKTNDDDICVLLDGDDYLYDPYVLNIIAKAYNTNDIYATFGSHVLINNDNINHGYYQNHKRETNIHGNTYVHLRTVKSFILKNVPIEYLKDRNNNWFIVSTDTALFTAVAELCKYKYMYILNKLMIYNIHNTLTNSNDGYDGENKKAKIRRTKYLEDIKNMKPLKSIILTSTKKNIIFTSAGDNTNFYNNWIGDNQNYDIWVIYYGGNDKKYNLYKNKVKFIDKRKGSKFQNFNYVWNKYYNELNNYNHFFILDDDIIFDSYNDINKMFNLATEYNSWVISPTFKIDGSSKISHKITKSQNNTLLRYVNFIEVNVPLFNNYAINKFMKYYDDILIGWGIDFFYIWALGKDIKDKYILVDDISIINPYDNKKNNRRELNNLKGVNKRSIEWNNIKNKYNIHEWKHKTWDSVKNK